MTFDDPVPLNLFIYRLNVMRCARVLSTNAINLQLAVIRVGIKLNVIYILKDQGCLCDPKLKVRLAGLGLDPFKDIVNIKDKLKVFG